MSETAAVSPTSQARLAPARNPGSRLSSLEAMERGFSLFRSTFPREGWRYYLGAAPFVLCFVPIWIVNGQIRVSDGTVLLEAALLACAYLFRVWMVCGYMQHVRERAFGTPTLKDLGVTARIASVARLFAWKVVLSIAALAVLPTVAGGSWFYSACQFASLEARGTDVARRSLSDCLGLASQWFGNGLILLFMLVPLWSAVWLNGLVLAIVLPQLLHSILGVDTLLSTQMGILALVESSAFWLMLFGGAWLALDPIVKCTFVIVYQHLRSRREGDDLRGQLASLPREQQKRAQMVGVNAAAGRAVIGAVFVIITMLSVFGGTASAQATQAPPTATASQPANSPAGDARIERLRTALNQQSQRAIYRWHDSEHPSPPSWLEKFWAKIERSIGRGWDRLMKLLGKLWPHGWNLSPRSGNGGWQLKSGRFWIAVLAVITIVSGGVLVWLRRRGQKEPVLDPQEIVALPFIDESAIASERSEDEWFALASQLEGTGEFRFALRAAYLGLLAGLAQREWLTIRRDRTNREYLNEFSRRWLRRPRAALEARPDIPEKFRGSLRQFDQVWYGAHVVTPEAVGVYRREQREFLSHV